MAGSLPYSSMLNQVMQNPVMSQMMQSLVANPQYLNQQPLKQKSGKQNSLHRMSTGNQDPNSDDHNGERATGEEFLSDSESSNNNWIRDEREVASSLILLAHQGNSGGAVERNNAAEERPTRVYTCSRCKKQFNTKQALGGHRSSHNGVGGCYLLERVHQTGNTSSCSSNSADQVADQGADHQVADQVADHQVADHQVADQGADQVADQADDDDVGNFRFDLNLPPPPSED